MATREELQKRLQQIELELEDTRNRLPAHSTKPPIMIALFALEEEREEILAELAELARLAPGAGER